MPDNKSQLDDNTNTAQRKYSKSEPLKNLGYTFSSIEQLLNNQLQSWHSLIEAIPIPIFIKGVDGKYIGCNKAFESFLGRSKEHIIGKTVYDMGPGEIADKYAEKDDELFAHPGSQIYEWKIQSADGRIKEVIFNKTTFYDINGRIAGLIGTISDITDIKKAKQESDKMENILNETGRMAKIGGWEHDLITGEGIWTDALYDIIEIDRSDKPPGVDEHLSYYPPKDRKILENAYQKAVENGIPFDLELQVYTAKGKLLWCRAYGEPICKDGKTVKMMGTFQDITEYKQAAEALKESEEKLRNIFENSTNLFYSHTPDHKITYLSPQVKDILGYTVEEAMIKWTEFITDNPVNQKGYELTLKAIKTGKTQPPYELEVKHKNGQKRWVEVREAPVVKNKKTVSIVGALIDITEKKNNENELNKLKPAVEQSLDGINITNINGIILYANPASESIYGYNSGELTGKHVKILNPEPKVSTYEIIPKTKEFGKWSGEITQRRKDGSVFEAYVSTSKIEKNGTIIGMLGIIRNITRRKKVEKQILEDRKKLKNLASKLTLTEEHQRRLLAEQLHDSISQSLVIAKLNLDELSQSQAPENVKKEIKNVSSLLNRAIRETRVLTFDLSYPVLYELGFEAAVESILNQNIRKQHSIDTEFEDDGREKPLDDDVLVLLFRSVRELLINVAKHSKAKNVKVSIEKINDKIQIIVADNGIGFNYNEVRSRIDTGGFGLFSINERIEQLQGTFDIESQPGKGCKVILTAPLKT